MHTDIIISGFGGQGVLFAGQLLAYAGMDQKLEVTWFPSYGPEMRGGTANCTVIMSDEEIGSPMVRYPEVVIALNLPSLDKYEGLVKPDGLLVLNSSIILRKVVRKDLRVVRVPGNEIAEKIGDKRLINMVMLGALLGNNPIFPLQILEKALEEHLPKRYHHLLPMNNQALIEGATYH
jgi:2-oxoglutarate ferredoxin oxidoreductase subunit gamma